MQVKSYQEALHFARCAGEDAANRRMRKARRTTWSDADYSHAVSVIEKMLLDLGFDVVAWAAAAGVPRNEPDELKPARQPPARKPGGRSKKEPVQLSFTFA